MNALFRYLLLKSGREGWLFGFILGPPVMLLSPFFVLAIFLVVRGQFTWPMVLDRNTVAGLRTVPEMLILVSGVAAAAAAFFSFAREVASHDIGSFILATRPRSVVFVSAVFGGAGAVVSYLVGQFALALIRASLVAGEAAVAKQTTAVLAAQVVLVCACGSCAGIAMLSISPAPTMMVPAYAIAAATGIFQMRRFGAVTVGLGIVEVVLLLTVATWFMRRRCAA